MIHVNQMALKRTYFETGVNKVELHIFSDASLEAMYVYGCLFEETRQWRSDLCHREM